MELLNASYILNCVEKAAKNMTLKRKSVINVCGCGARFTGVELVGELMG